MVQIYKKILIGKGIEEKIKRKTATNHHNKQQQLAPPPCPSPKGLLFIHISINLKFVIRIILYNTEIIDF